ncbi:unnamed protein product [marine sediment metagenome]|uniref:Uncharacterized protein n=1 Tax=marine sediment metagenome TaxID=412755 RepID=X1VM66_9ZZZZ
MHIEIDIPTYAIENIAPMLEEYKKCSELIETLTLPPYLTDFIKDDKVMQPFLEEREKTITHLLEKKYKLMGKIKDVISKFVRTEAIERVSEKILKEELP